MKVVILALLATSILSAKLTPRTPLPAVFDDMVFNSLGGLHKKVPSNPSVNVVSAPIKLGEAEKLSAFIGQTLPWVPADRIAYILRSGIKLKPLDIETHYLFESVTAGNLHRYALINFIKVEANLIQAQIVGEIRGVYGARINSFHHEVSSSTLGLMNGDTKVVFQGGDQGYYNPDLHKRFKERLLSAIVEKRGTQKIVALGAGEEEPAPPKPEEGEKKEEKSGGIASILGGATNIINQLAEGYKSIVSAFKTIKKEELKEKITGEGFNEYNSKSRYLRSIGIPKTYWATYKTQFMQLTGIAKNEKVKPDIEALLKMADFIADNAWNTNDLTFDVTKGGSCSNFVCLTRYDSVIEKYHIMTTVVDGTFQLAPNIWVYTKYKSVAGGIVETTKVVTKNVPRSITEADVKAVNAMMLLTSINIMQENFGVPKTLPEFSVMTQGILKA